MRAVVQGCSRQDAWNIILPLPRTDSPYGAGWPGMTECHLRNNHPLRALHSVLVPLWFLGLDNWASNTLPSLRKSRHWCRHTVLPVQAQPYGLAAGCLQSVHCFVWSGLIIVNMKASRLMPVHIAQMLQSLSKLSSQEECDEAV